MPVGHGVVDPVQDDEGHAANHDQEAAEQEGGSLEKRTVCRDMLAFYADDDNRHHLTDVNILPRSSAQTSWIPS